MGVYRSKSIKFDKKQTLAVKICFISFRLG